MNSIITINDTDIAVKEYGGKCVITFKDIDTVHRRPEGTARQRFNDNKKHFVEGEDYFNAQMSEKRTLGFDIPNRGLTLITESGYYMLVKSFTDDLSWDVQRQLVNGYFRAQQMPDSYMIDDPVKRAERWIEEQREKQRLLTTVAVQEQQIAELQPKASYYEVVLNCKDLLSITSIAKDYGKSGTWLNKYLHEKGVQYKQGKIWLLYQKYAEKGYTSTKTQTFPGNDGQQHTSVHTYWTQKGRLFIYDLLKADKILPLIEQEEKTAKEVA